MASQRRILQLPVVYSDHLTRCCSLVQGQRLGQTCLMVSMRIAGDPLDSTFAGRSYAYLQRKLLDRHQRNTPKPKPTEQCFITSNYSATHSDATQDWANYALWTTRPPSRHNKQTKQLSKRSQLHLRLSLDAKKLLSHLPIFISVNILHPPARH